MMLKRIVLFVTAACGGSDGVAAPDPGGPPPANLTLALQSVATGFSSPVYVTSPPGDGRLFVVEQTGRIQIISNGVRLSTPFLDIDALVLSGGERGLLGLAFHPQYAANGFFYVNYTREPDGATVVARYRRSAANANAADASSAQVVLVQPQPFANHNGGHLAFGPDGMLYIPLGDGGSGGDPQENAQNLDTWLGKLLRIDVNSGTPYAVPVDNPFSGQSGPRREIWALGLRNPWRMSFDAPTNRIYIADVGQGNREEINVQPRTAAGLNYGWDTMEGDLCFEPQSGCNTSGLTLPAHVYTTHQGGTCAVVGGFVYRGAAIPEMTGHYFFTDYCTGGVRSFRFANGAVQDVRTWTIPQSTGTVSSFGVDSSGELYVVSHSGTIWRLIRGS